MKKKVVAAMLGITLSLTMAITGCAQGVVSAGTTTEEASAEQAAEETVTKESQTLRQVAGSEENSVSGEVVSVTEDAITIKKGTIGEDGTLTVGEEEVTIPVTESTVIGKGGMKGGPGGRGGMNSTNGSANDTTNNESAAQTEGNTTDGSSQMPQMNGEQPPELPSGEAPSGEMPQMNGEQPPELPSGEAPSGEMPQMNGQQPPELLSGEAPSGEMPQMNGEQPPELPSGEASTGGTTESGESASSGTTSDNTQSTQGGPRGGMGMPGGRIESITDLTAGSQITVTLDDDGNAKEITVLDGMPGMGMPGGRNGQGMPGGQNGDNSSGQGMQGGPGGQSAQPESYDAAQEYTGDVTESGKTIASTGTDENAVHVYDGATVNLSNMTITRESSNSSGGDSASFYGVGAATLVTDGTVTIEDSTITTNASGGAGVFAYGDGTAYVKNTTIKTEQGASGGIHVAGGGTLYATDLTVETNGGSSAAIRSDRGGGTMEVDGGTYTSNGSGSPAIYSTADIAVKNATLEATGSEAICIEGLNSVTLTDCDLTGNMPDDEQNDCTWNVILYQSMSGDSEIGNSTFTMTGGSLTAKNGGMFYTTNTESTFTLEDVDITYADENDFFLKCTGNANARGWGQTGANGADCTFTAIKQEMEGDIIWDSISTLDFAMTDGSTLTGAIIQDETNAGNGGSGTATISIDQTSKWIVTGDSTVTTLENAGTIVDTNGKTVTIKGTDGTVYVQGNGSYTITVDTYVG